MKRLICTLATLFSLATCDYAIANDEVNLYSARKEQLIQPLLDQFTVATGIKVNLLTGKADALIQRLNVEGANSPADLLITVDAGRLHRAKMMHLLQPVTSEILTINVPATLSDTDGYWYGLSTRVRPIMYAKTRVNSDEISNYEDLVDARWQGRICVQSSSNIYNQSLVASMIASHSEEKALQWSKGFVANFARAPVGGDRDQIKALSTGECDIAIANTYYLAMMLRGKDKAQRKAAKKVAIFWPNQKGRGAHINVSGIGVTASSKNKANAIKLMEFLVSEAAQKWYASVNFEYPVRDNVEVSKVLQKWGDFKADSLNLTKLGEHNPVAVKLMDKAGWR